MTAKAGTYGMADLLAIKNQSAAAFGLDTIVQVLDADRAAHNEIVGQMVGDLCDVTSDIQRVNGSSLTGSMTEVDEYGAAQTQKDVPSAQVAFPLKKFQFATGWTKDWLYEATPRDLALGQENAKKADLKRIQYEIKSAMYPSGNVSFTDKFKTRLTLTQRRFWNADGDPIPDGQNGETFDGSTHTHYLATASLAASDLQSAIQTVVEHGYGGQVKLFISHTDEAAVRALTGFSAYLDPRVTFNANANQPNLRRLDITRLDNRAIGIFDAAEVWVKPWAIASYLIVSDTGNIGKPLAFRQKEQPALQGLQLASDFNAHPLTARYWERYMGVGVWTRGNGAVLYTGAGSYADPTIVVP